MEEIINNEKIEVAERMLDDGEISVDKIAKYLELPVEVVKDFMGIEKGQRIICKTGRTPYDIKREQTDRYPQLLFRLVFQQNQGGIFVRAKSHEFTSDQQSQPIA